MSFDTSTSPTKLICNGCGLVSSKKDQGTKVGDRTAILLAHPDWRWTTSYQQVTRHFCLGCVALGRFALAYEQMNASFRRVFPASAKGL